MGAKKVCLLVDLRTGEHVAKVPALVTIFAAAGWKTDVVLKLFSGETLKLALKAARKGYDIVLGYGGDGTFNAVFNGVMYAGGKNIVADIPGGTFNVWASAIGIPNDPIQAALAIVNSEARRIDLGHIEIDGLTVSPGSTQQTAKPPPKKHKKPMRPSKNAQYFLLNVGMGFDAQMMAHISKPLKYRFGPLAFNLSMLKELPEQRPFPVELQVSYDGDNTATHWQGEVWEVFVSKVPLFGGQVILEPEARADDGQLYVALITAHGPLKSLEQVFAMVIHHKPDDVNTQFFKAPHFSISIPASIAVHVDGGVIKLEDYLHKSAQALLQQVHDPAQVMVNYRFDARPDALSTTIPMTYNGALFSKPSRKKSAPPSIAKNGHPQNAARLEPAQQNDAGKHETAYPVKVIGSTPNPELRDTYIVAGSITKEETDETEVVAVVVNAQTPVFDAEQGQLAPTNVLQIEEGTRIEVAGEKNKRNVIRARHINILH